MAARTKAQPAALRAGASDSEDDLMAAAVNGTVACLTDTPHSTLLTLHDRREKDDFEIESGNGQWQTGDQTQSCA